MTEVLVTGANGFIGRRLFAHLSSRGDIVRGAVRVVGAGDAGSNVFPVGEVGPSTDWTAALGGIRAVVHLAARAHVLRDKAHDPAAEFWRVNVDGTMNLARQCRAAGVRRFVFVSSIGVNGAETRGRAFSADDPPAPHSLYAKSKLEAERKLIEYSSDCGMDLVIIRPPMVLGPQAPGNMGRLVRYLESGVPLPFGAINNKRSLVSLDNLVDLVSLCLTHDSAPGNTFLVSDGEDISTTELLTRLSLAMDKQPRLVPVPAVVLQWLAVLAGRRGLATQVCGSLQVDTEKTRIVLGWKPPLSLDEGIRRTVVVRPKS